MTHISKVVAAGLTLMTLALGSPIAGLAADAPEALVGHAAAGVATVEAIDRETRKITLKGEGGSTTITAGPEVRNFDRIKKGDLVVFEYFEGLVVTLAPGLEGVPAREDAVAITRAARGDRPGAAAAQATTAVGKVKAIDREHRIVLVEGPRRTVALKVADGVDLKSISVGDAVLARYEAAYAISVQPPADVDAEVLIQSKSIALGVGYEWGKGTLTMRDGSRYDLKVKGLSIVDVGITKINAAGYVYNLEDAGDFAGNYTRAEAGIALVGGVSTAVLKNDKGVVIRMMSEEAGLKLKLAPGGFKIEIVE